jgi:hypothetical protein
MFRERRVACRRGIGGRGRMARRERQLSSLLPLPNPSFESFSNPFQPVKTRAPFRRNLSGKGAFFAPAPTRFTRPNS